MNAPSHNSRKSARTLIFLDNFANHLHYRQIKSGIRTCSISFAVTAILLIPPAVAEQKTVNPLGQCGICQKDPGRCIEACSRLIDTKATPAEILWQAFKIRGDMKSRIGEPEHALADYTRAIALNPGNAGLYNNRGIAHTRQGRFDDAIRDFTRALDLAPGLARLYINRALAHFGKRQYADAVQDMDKAFNLDPEDARAFNNRGIALSRLGRFDDAIRDFDRAVALAPEYAIAFNNRGIAHAGKGAFDAAIQNREG